MMGKKRWFYICTFVVSFVLMQSQLYAMIDLEFEDEPGYFYNYCPSYIQADEQTRYIYYCKNMNSAEIYDRIYYRKGTKMGDQWIWGEQKVALEPSNNGWDDVHVCDPDVKKGTYNYNGHTYSYGMFYLGCDQLDNSHNQLGIAFADSPEGPWVKYNQNPLIEHNDTTTWGIGQSSATSIDGLGKMLLFYTKGESWSDVNMTSVYRREIDLSDMSSPIIGTEYQLFKDGIEEKGVSDVFFHNVAFAYDIPTDRFYISRDRWTQETTHPNYVSSEIEVLYTSGTELWSNSGRWKSEGYITSEHTGHTRNHNSTLLTDQYGMLVGGSNHYQVTFTVSDTGENHLWGYRLASVGKDSLITIDRIDGQTELMDYSGNWNDFYDSSIDAYYMGTNKFSNAISSSIEFSFKGTNIAYFGSKGLNGGIVDIYVDQVLVGTVDTYHSSRVDSANLWSINNLNNAEHTIKLVVQSDNNPLSHGYEIGIDYFSIE